MEDKAKRIGFRFLISIIAYFFVVGFWTAVKIMFEIILSVAAYETSDHFIAVWGFIILLLITFLVMSAVEVNNNEKKCDYLDKIKEKSTFSAESKNIILSFDFLIEFACFAVLSAVMPFSFGLGCIAGSFLDKSSLSPIQTKIISWVIYIVLLFMIEFCVFYYVHKGWRRDHYDGKANKKNPIVRTIKNLIVVLIGCLILFSGFACLIPLASTLLLLARGNREYAVKIIIAVLSVIAAVIVIVFARALLKQRRFMRSLRRVCSKESIALSEVKKPYSSVFREQRGYNFSVSVGEKEFRCKIIAGVWKGSPLAFSENGNGICLHTFRLFKTELYPILSRFDFSFESDTTKILIIVPTPSKLFVGTENTRLLPADNGETVGNYQIFTSSAFLSALERKCIGK